MFRFWLFLLLPVLTGCDTIAYKEDVGFLVGIQANSHEVPVRINGAVCRDMNNLPGACTLRVKSTDTIVFRHDPVPYSYQFVPKCSPGVRVPDGATVPPNIAYEWTLRPADFAEMRSFVCAGEILPQDRQAPVSAAWRAAIVVVDAAYEKREGMFIHEQNGKKHLIMGQYARMAWVFDELRWKRYNTTTSVEIKGDPAKVRAYSESYAMRYNFFNLTNVVP